MIAVALKGLLGRKVRALLTAFAVVIGVAMVSGTLVLTDTIQKAFDGIFTASYAQTDAVIAGKEKTPDNRAALSRTGALTHRLFGVGGVEDGDGDEEGREQQEEQRHSRKGRNPVPGSDRGARLRGSTIIR